MLISVMLFASGHLSSITLSTLAASNRGGSDLAVGMLTSLPFVGMFVGSILMPKILARTRHVRLIALATAGCGLTLLFLPRIDNLAVWALLRFAYGIFAAGVWLCFDTWMADMADPKNRGKTLALYQVIVLAGIAIGQALLVTADDHIDLGFNIATAAMVAAVIPVCCTKMSEPSLESTTRSLSLAMAWKLSPLSLLGALSAGLCFSNFAFVLLSYSKQGVEAGKIALLGSAMMIAGIAGQFGIGYLSDRLGNRRLVMQGTIVATLLGIAATSFVGVAELPWYLTVTFCALFWGLIVTIYPISVAIGGDVISKENFQPFAAKAFLSIQIGFSIGPLVGSVFLATMPVQGPFVLVAIVMGALLLLSMSRRVMAMHTPASTEDFAPMAMMGVNPEIADPRSEPSIDDETAQDAVLDPQSTERE